LCGGSKITGVRARRSGKDQVAIAIPDAIADAANIKGLIQIAVGSNDDVGFIRISQANGLAGFRFKKRGKNSCADFRLTASRFNATMPAKAITLPHKIVDGALLLDITPLQTT